jgi:hypothetical protein
MDLIFYPKLGIQSREAIFDKSRKYYPDSYVVGRLARKTGMSTRQVRSQLRQERKYLLATLDALLS